MPGVLHPPEDGASRKAGNPTPKPSGDLPRLHVLARPTHNLPFVLSSFIGREREIEQVKHLLSGSRLVTLTGVGGCGKSRLAIQVATNLVDSFKDGVWWVELADEILVPQAVAKALGGKSCHVRTTNLL